MNGETLPCPPSCSLVPIPSQASLPFMEGAETGGLGTRLSFLEALFLRELFKSSSLKVKSQRVRIYKLQLKKLRDLRNIEYCGCSKYHIAVFYIYQGVISKQRLLYYISIYYDYVNQSEAVNIVPTATKERFFFLL